MKLQHIRAALAVPLALGLAGCGHGSGAGTGAGGTSPQGAVTVTVTPTVTAAPTESQPSSSTASAPPSLKSDVKGRAFDFGTVTEVRTEKGVDVLTLDRWTWKGLEDARLSTSGVPLKAFKGTPYENQNDKLTYDIPVAEGARLLHHHCVTADQPLQTKSVAAKDLSGLAEREKLVLVKLDAKGHLVAADNLPGCPG
jgi:hypothetical protein